MRVKLNTMRVRFATSTTLTERTSPTPMSTLLLPRPLAVLGKSSAIRAGLVTVKPAGLAVKGSLKLIRITTLPLCSAVVLTDSSKFLVASWENADKLTAKPSNKAAYWGKRLSRRSELKPARRYSGMAWVYIIYLPFLPTAEARFRARPNRRLCLERFL